MDTHRNDIKALTGVRGIAALWVAVYHVLLLDTLPWPVNNLISHGYLAVDMFFILSGFVMALSYRHLFEKKVFGRNYLIFLIRRFARIYPLYFVATLFIVLINIVHVSKSWDPSIASLLENIFLIQGWGLGNSIDGASWSISTELAAYLLFPVFVMTTLRGKYALATSAALYIIGIITLSQIDLSAYEVNGHWPMNIYYASTPYPLIRCLCEFGVGLVTFRLALSDKVKGLISSTLVSVVLFMTSFTLLFIRDTDVIFIATIPFIIIVLSTASDNLISRLFAWKPVFFLGEISYAVYLLHFEFLRVRVLGKPWLIHHNVQPVLAEVTASSMFLVGLLFTSYVAFRFLEVPARRAIRRLEDRLGRNAGEVVNQSEAAGQHDSKPTV